MGIPHLITTLQPFAQQGFLKDEAIVIDGPAFAYHILEICRRNGITQPSYAVLGCTAVRWLSELSMHSFIDGIYFDGYLPKSKIDVRMERMVKATSQLNQFHAAYPDGCPERHLQTTRETAAVDLFAFQTSDTRKLLPPPFLVPAIIDALKASHQYSKVLRIVPGEADTFCARHLARAKKGVVLTSDSDLLVHDLAGGRVVFFRDIYLSQGKWKAPIFDPEVMCRNFSDGIRRFAYELSLSPHSTVPELALACSQPMTTRSDDYKIFCQQYQNEIFDQIESYGPELESMDPRVSEVSIQMGPVFDEPVANIYLPVLVESPMRASAWESSISIRQLAYTILKFCNQSTTSMVNEYRRVQTHQQQGKPAPLLLFAEIPHTITELIRRLNLIKIESRGKIEMTGFGLMNYLYICGDGDGKSPVTRVVVQQLQKQQQHSQTKLAWDMVHLTAQLQAFNYSLRILWQVLQLVPGPQHCSWSKEAGDLKRQLKVLPPLTEFPEVHEVVEFFNWLPGSEMKDAVRRFLKVPEPDAKTPPSDGKRKRRRGQLGPREKRTKQQQYQRRQQQYGGNRFNHLPDE
ncbi:hypothetical protein GMORB2_4203 [Geosmithia morbida]|uniref:Asteroid domain-containing protein n=1 Tax=Geosmithia morbida TaxID=1094350 RepID=A0A9P4YYD6_9HYPO|nr:uncharacterized protein GMORB2_4203 [Geosmithia morbida]KAF4125363.1 hypothetical protein GMORB2_4203 [Geosmithia morbida]